MTKVLSAYRKKAQGELPELRELILSEKRGGNEILRGQIGKRREDLFENIQRGDPSPERVFKKSKSFEELLRDRE